jgi:hypothetical protein
LKAFLLIATSAAAVFGCGVTSAAVLGYSDDAEGSQRCALMWRWR